MKIKHSGALGDIIYSIPFLRSLNTDIELYVGEHTLVNNQINKYNTEKVVTEINTLFKDNHKSVTPGYTNYKMIKPLLESQPYIKVFPITDDICYDIDIDDFRIDWDDDTHISDMILRRFNNKQLDWHLDINLVVHKNDQYNNSFVCCRTFRYRNESNNREWRVIFDTLKLQGLTPVFIGLDNEYDDFTNTIGHAEHVPTTDLLEAAVIINSCSTGIYNPSAPLAIAQMLNKPNYVEGKDVFYINSIRSKNKNQTLF
jgi:hypothetical protein